jgi:hypothetical protein
MGIPLLSTSGTGFLLIRWGELTLILGCGVALGVGGVDGIWGIVSLGRLAIVADSRAFGVEIWVMTAGTTLTNDTV